MASTSTQMKYDVFLSFRGEDTRNTFTSHLYKALCDKQIETFIDYKQLNGGDEVSPSLLSAIEESHISIVIFSKNYASSRLCLQELVKIVECRENSENHKRIVIPVFYEIDPFDVKNQTGSYAEALARHEQRLMESFDKVRRVQTWKDAANLSGLNSLLINYYLGVGNRQGLVRKLRVMQKHLLSITGSYAEAFAQHEQRLDRDQRIQTWKDALKQAANLFGFDSRVIKPDSVFVNIIVDDVLKKLNKMSPSYNKNLPGMNSRIEEILSLLRRDVGRLGIWGIGGIGKTTLANEVSKKISCQFESSCFVSSVREYSKQGRLDSLRRSLLSTLLKDENAYMSTSIEKRLGRKKFLIILDDVTTFKQIEDLIRDLECLDLESRIIITSRNKQVLNNCKVHHIYEVEELCFNDALKLFCQCGFKQNCPKVDYKKLSNSVVEKVGGVPLALKVLGSALFEKPKEVWESALEKLENSFDKDIHDALKLSYDELDDNEKSIFLDIACFYKGWNIDAVKVIMDACGFFGGIGISNLIDKSLITVSGNTLTMHDLFQEMGKKIVQQESNDPSKGIRLWRHRDIYDALTKAKGTKRTEAISLDMSSSEVRDIKINPYAFEKMKKLRVLNFHVKNGWENRRNKVHVLDGLVESNLTELKYLHWYGCPLKSIQRKFHFEKLVVLEMPDSNIEELWNDSVQTLHNLKKIDLAWSQHLISCPDLSLVPNLESLMLSGCTSLESIPDCTCLESLKQLAVYRCSKLKRLPQLPPNLEDIGLYGCTSLVEIQSSFTHLHKVRSLFLFHLYSLTSIPDLRGLKSLTNLVISYCSKLKMLPELPNNIEELSLHNVPIEVFPPSWEDLDRLRDLRLEECPMLKSLPSSVRKWKSLDIFSMRNCSKIDKLPDDIGALESLKHFKAEGTAIGEVPSSISCLKSLTYLCMSRCEGVDGAGLLLPPNLLGLENLFKLILSDCGIATLPDSLGDLTSLHVLDLKSNNFESIPGSIINLSKLYNLDISYCKRLRELPQLPAVTDIIAENCTSLERLSNFEFQNDIFEEPSSQNANFVNCYKLDPDALNDVVYDTRRKIKGQADLVKKDTLRKIYDQQNDDILPASIIYPGSKIPKWFENQSGESFIEVELPSDCLYSNFLYFALCVVVAPNPDHQCNHPDFEGHSYSRVTFDCNVKSKDGNESNLFGHHRYPKKHHMFLWMPYCGPAYLKSNHVITYFGYHFFREFCDNEFSFKFNVENFDCDGGLIIDDDKEHFKVEMCGVHLMSHLHFEVSDEEDESHLEESDEEDELHPKRLKLILPY